VTLRPIRGHELTITPARIVAPLNPEVVMARAFQPDSIRDAARSGMDADQDGVGQIVAVGHEKPRTN